MKTRNIIMAVVVMSLWLMCGGCSPEAQFDRYVDNLDVDEGYIWKEVRSEAIEYVHKHELRKAVLVLFNAWERGVVKNKAEEMIAKICGTDAWGYKKPVIKMPYFMLCDGVPLEWSDKLNALIRSKLTEFDMVGFEVARSPLLENMAERVYEGEVRCEGNYYVLAISCQDSKPVFSNTVNFRNFDELEAVAERVRHLVINNIMNKRVGGK